MKAFQHKLSDPLPPYLKPTGKPVSVSKFMRDYDTYHKEVRCRCGTHTWWTPTRHGYSNLFPAKKGNFIP